MNEMPRVVEESAKLRKMLDGEPTIEELQDLSNVLYAALRRIEQATVPFAADPDDAVIRRSEWSELHAARVEALKAIDRMDGVTR